MTRTLPRTLLCAVALGGLSLVAACSGKPDGELDPGQWKTTMSISKFDVPGAPPQVQEQMKAAMSRSQSMESCMTPEEAKQGVRKFSSESQRGGCKMEEFTQGGGKMAGTLKCEGGMQVMKMQGTYTATKVDMTMAGDISGGGLPGGKASLEMKIASERTGDCPAKK